MTFGPDDRPEHPADLLRAAWAAAGPPPDLGRFIPPDAPEALVAEIVEADAEQRLDRGLPASIEHYAALIPGLTEKREVCRALLMLQLAGGAGAGALKERYPTLARDIDLVAELHGLATPALSSGEGDHSAARVAAHPPERPKRLATAPGAHLGKYRLVEPLGRGSFGEVWTAWDGELHRYIALKLIRPRDGADQVGTLLDEARAAAALEHENVVRVHAAGLFEDAGLCYIDSQIAGDPAPTATDPKAIAVGRPMDRLGGPSRPGWRDIARLMEAVARGVAAAHARGITHRDIKPANIIVTPSGRPMVADFGLSRLAPEDRPGGDPVATAASLAGGSVRIVGTPSYMSPEQARGEPATPLSDVYALGSTLCFLLRGSHPYQPSGRNPDPRWDVVEQVREGEPIDLPPEVPAALAAICAKAMAFEPRDRYLSAALMAEDLRNWLEDRPTAAHPLSAGERLRLAAKRNAAVTSVAAAAVLVLTAATAWYVIRVTDERDLAFEAESIAVASLAESRRQFDRSNATLKFLTDMIASAGQAPDPGEVKLTELLELAARTLDESPVGEPEVEAAVRGTLGQIFQGLELYGQAEPQLRKVYELRRSMLGDRHTDTIRAQQTLGWLLVQSYRVEEGAELMVAAHRAAEATLGREHPEAILAAGNLGRVLAEAGLREPAAAILDRAVEDSRRVLGPSHAGTLMAEVGLARLHAQRGRYAEAVALLRSAFAAARSTLGDSHPTTLGVGAELVGVLAAAPETGGEAVAAAHELVRAAETALGPDHPSAMSTRRLLAGALRSAGRFDDAATELARLADAQARLSGPAHPYTLDTLSERALVLRFGARAEEAESLMQGVVGRASEALSPMHPMVLAFRAEHAECLAALGRFEEAEREALAAHRDLGATDGPARTAVLEALVHLYEAWGKPEEAARWAPSETGGS